MLHRTRRPSHGLTRAGLVIAPGPRHRGGLVLAVAAALAFAAGVGLTSAWHRLQPARDDPALAQQQRVNEQQGLALGLAEARAVALEGQVEGLNQQMRECREELSFFRQAREATR